ncbi:MAG: hypothetical protein JSS09_05160, partial [Verrucomicrobia bacterium]|nr:hypothetical protein [Verrucomicrobiota bacterium]
MTPMTPDFGIEGLKTETSPSKSSAVTGLDSLPKTPSLEVKSYVGGAVIKGGQYLQAACEGLSKAMAPINKLMAYYFPEDQRITKQNARVETAKTSIEAAINDPESNNDIIKSSILREKM